MTAGGRHWPADVLTGVAVYVVTSLPVALGVVVATTPGVMIHDGPTPSVLTCLGYFDGGHYFSVLNDGYEFRPGYPCNIAFAPGYPLAAGLVARLTGCRPNVALVVTANLAFVAALALLSAYLRARAPDEPAPSRVATLAAVGLWPAGFYFRMAYSEGLFLAVLALLLLGLARRWPAWVLALVAGAATGVRPVGVAAGAAVVVYVLADPARGSVRRRLLTAAVVGPLCCWGLLAFMGYQYARFGTPTAFATAHAAWLFYVPGPDDLGPKWVRLALAEPLWNVYVPDSPRYWARIDSHGRAILGTAFWNPVFFVLAVAAVVFGRARGWLTGPETVLGLGLLAIPYLTRADEMSMLSHARFTSVVVPAFVVAGRLLGRAPAPVAWAAFVILAPVLTMWTAMFGATWLLF